MELAWLSGGLWILSGLLYRASYYGNNAYHFVTSCSTELLDRSFRMVEEGEVDEESEEQEVIATFTRLTFNRLLLRCFEISLAFYLFFTNSDLVYWLSASILYKSLVMVALSYHFKNHEEPNVFVALKVQPDWLSQLGRISDFCSAVLFSFILYFFYITA